MREAYADVTKLAAAYPGLFDGLERLSASAVEAIRTNYPFVLDDYLAFVAEIGFGSFGGDRLALYSGPVDAAEVLDETSGSHAGLVLIGDDFAGYYLGFVPGSVGLFEVSFDDAPELISPDFATFIRAKAAEFVEHLDG